MRVHIDAQSNKTFDETIVFCQPSLLFIFLPSNKKCFNMLPRKNQKYERVDTEVDREYKLNQTEPAIKRPFSKTCLWSAFFTGALISIYYAPSIGLTFYQRWLYKSFKYPLATVLVHMVVKLILAACVRSLLSIKYGKQRLNLTWKEYIITVAPMSVFSGFDIGFSNWGLELIHVSMYTMTKSSTIIFILGFAILFKLEKKSCNLIAIVLMIAFGLSLFTYKAEEFNVAGFLLVLIASMCSGLRWTCIQMVMQKSKSGMKNPIDMIYHMQCFMILSLLPFMVFIEGGKLIAELQTKTSNELSSLLVKVLLGAFIAFFMEVAEVMIVSYTSSLTLTIAGIFKEILILILAVLTGDTLTLINVLGLVICLGGIAMHMVHKIQQMQAQPVPAPIFDACDVNNSRDAPLKRSLLGDHDVEQFDFLSDDSDEDTQVIFDILNRHER